MDTSINTSGFFFFAIAPHLLNYQNLNPLNNRSEATKYHYTNTNYPLIANNNSSITKEKHKPQQQNRATLLHSQAFTTQFPKFYVIHVNFVRFMHTVDPNETMYHENLVLNCIARKINILLYIQSQQVLNYCRVYGFITTYEDQNDGREPLFKTFQNTYIVQFNPKLKLKERKRRD